MLFDVVSIILAVYALISPYFLMKAVKLGVMCAEKPEKAAEEPVFSVPKKKKKPELPPQVQRDIDILANIDRFDGTSDGQMEVKNV